MNVECIAKIGDLVQVGRKNADTPKALLKRNGRWWTITDLRFPNKVTLQSQSTGVSMVVHGGGQDPLFRVITKSRVVL